MGGSREVHGAEDWFHETNVYPGLGRERYEHENDEVDERYVHGMERTHLR